MIISFDIAPGETDVNSEGQIEEYPLTLPQIFLLAICLFCDATIAYGLLRLVVSIPSFVVHGYTQGTFLLFTLLSSYVIVAYLMCCECYYEKATIAHGSFNVSYVPILSQDNKA
jgi:hypothetical protein